MSLENILEALEKITILENLQASNMKEILFLKRVKSF